MRPTIKKLRIVCERDNETEPYAKYIIRPISIYFTWLFVRTPISANQITILQGMFGVAGAIMFGYQRYLLGSLVLQIGFILDNVDGEVARWKGQQGESGKYLDLVQHRIVIPLYFFGLGIGTGYVIAGMLAGLFTHKLTIDSDEAYNIVKKQTLRLLFAYPASMNVILLGAILNQLNVVILFYAYALTIGRLGQVYSTFKEIKL